MSQQNTRPWKKPLLMESDDGKNHYVMECRGLKLIGIRFYRCPENRIRQKKAMNTQKNLYGKEDWIYFNKGFTITEEEKDNPNAVFIDVEADAFDSSFLLYSDGLNLQLGFGAVIGQNGTGKSTIVDMVIRLINNLSAAIIGEGYVYSSAQHLHYIENVYASLAVYIDTKIRILTCKGKQLYISDYETDLNKLACADGNATECYCHTKTTTILDGSEPEDELLKPQDGMRHVLREWFYTMVGNYSLYAYNYRDYESERTRETKLKLLRKIRPEDTKKEDDFWLKGVFHKNDGYQTPVVIHPMRNNGYVNAAQVNYLGKQNLVELAFEKGTDRELGREKFPFRIINQTHHLVGLYFNIPQEHENYKGFVKGMLKDRFNLDQEQKVLFGGLENLFKEFWADAVGVTYNGTGLSVQERVAWDYVAYKTIKIFRNYKHYEKAWNNLNGKGDANVLKKHLEELMKDSSHRTKKLRQALAYLKYKGERDYYMNKDVVVDVDDIYAWMETKIGEPLYYGKDYHNIEVEDLLPPPYPITDVMLQLVDDEHLDEYKQIKNKSLNIIPFEGLSAGERQIAYTLGNIVYHLKNIESAKKDYNAVQGHVESQKYDYVNIMLDEVELYFHPDLQRRFVSLLIDAIKGLKMNGMSGINVTLITHSPFVLSDIPTDNILCLSRKKEDKLEGKTFAANIHDLFNNSFFLPYTVGEVARKEISEIVGLYQRWRTIRPKADENENRWRVSEQSMQEITERRWAKMKYIANAVGDDYLSDELRDMIDEIEGVWHEED